MSIYDNHATAERVVTKTYRDKKDVCNMKTKTKSYPIDSLKAMNKWVELRELQKLNASTLASAFNIRSDFVLIDDNNEIDNRVWVDI